MKALKMDAMIDKDRKIVLELPPDVAEGPVEVIVLLEEASISAPASTPPEAAARERVRRFRAWVESHDPSLPVLPPEALRREEMYGEG